MSYLAERHPHWSFVGVELLTDRLQKAETIRRRMGLNNIQYVKGDICALPFVEEFDLVICLDVLEHIENDRQAVGSMMGALVPGGHLLITSPSQPQPPHLPLVKWRERRIGFDISEYGHVRHGYSESMVQEMFRDCGAAAVDLRYTYGKAGTLAFDLFFSIGDNKPNPVLFAGLFSLLKFLAWIDVHDNPKHGAAVLAVATKPANAQRAPA
jgi:SAM-dependent methyltransferase